jgi:hypothetical protein
VKKMRIMNNIAKIILSLLVLITVNSSRGIAGDDRAVIYNKDTGKQTILGAAASSKYLNDDGSGNITWQTVSSGGDSVTVNSSATTNANLLDNIYLDWLLDTGSDPDDITAKFNYNATSGDIALSANEVAWTLNGLVSEGATADTIEGRFAFPDWASSDKLITFQDATHTVVGRDTTDTLTNKTLAAADNVVEADTGDSATSFFSAGTIEAARLPDADDDGTTKGISTYTDADFDATTGLISIVSGITRDSEWDTEGEVQTAWGGVNILLETEIDASSELRALMDDESGTGALLFAAGDIGAGTATTPSANDDDTSIATTAYVQTEINAAGGRSITCASGSCDADAELYTNSFTFSYPANPVDTDDFLSIWCNDTGKDLTLTKLKCESDQTVTMMFQVDDGTPADVDSVDLVCVSTPDTDTSLDGDTTVADGECLDIATTSVASTPTRASATFTGTFGD